MSTRCNKNACQAKLVRLPVGEGVADGSPHEPPTRAEYIVGTCDPNGHLAIRPVRCGATPFNVRTFGAAGNRAEIEVDRAELAALQAKKRGPKPKEVDARDKKIAQLERELEKATRRAERAEALLDLPNKVA
jgi:hypothetical protein